jgi:c-di-GMP-binding flagellar brake protein YcgR/cbb3-type cytochrome oxidase subunit 3
MPIILDEQKLAKFLDDISRGFKQSPMEILLALTLLLLFIGFLIFMYKLQKKRLQETRNRRYLELYEAAMAKLNLNPSELYLLERLARYLKTPERKYLLLVNHSTFNACASRLCRQEDVQEVSLSSFRIKLGFSDQDPERIPSSTAELPQGLPVLITSRIGNRATGRVAGSQPQSLIISPTEPIQLPCGIPVTVYFQNRSGVFSFTSHVQDTLGKAEPAIHLAHSETIRRTQRRAYYRKKLTLPIFVRPAGSEEKPLLSAFLDLGGGGASLRNQQNRYKAGTDLELTFLPSGADRLSLTAKVIRTSRGGRVLHVRFGTITDSARDRIIGSLFLKARTRKDK